MGWDELPFLLFLGLRPLPPLPDLPFVGVEVVCVGWLHYPLLVLKDRLANLCPVLLTQEPSLLFPEGNIILVIAVPSRTLVSVLVAPTVGDLQVSVAVVPSIDPSHDVIDGGGEIVGD